MKVFNSILPKNLFNLVSLILILVTLIFGVSAQTVFAQQTIPSDNDVNAIAKEMYCPVCENIPLDVCPTQACAQWRELIRLKLSQGWNEQQIKDYFVAQYGDRVLAEPPARGLHWMVYILPPVIFLIGVYILYRVFTSMRRTRGASAAAAADTVEIREDDPYLKKLEDELRNFEGDSPAH